MTSESKKSRLVSRIIAMVMGLIAGAMILVLAALLTEKTVTTIVHWVMIIYGVIIMISNIPPLISGIAHINRAAGVIDLVSAILGILLGLALIFYQGVVLVAAIGVYMILFPLIRILVAGDKKAQFKQEWLRIVLGVALLIFLPAVMDAAYRVIHLVLVILGWAVIALAAIGGLVGIILTATGKDMPAAVATDGKRLYVDFDGDGTVDAVFEDKES